MATVKAEDEYTFYGHNGKEIPWQKVGDYHRAVIPELQVSKKMLYYGRLVWDSLKCSVLAVILIIKAVFSMLIQRSPRDIRNELAVVTGGANGLGREIAVQLIRHGARVAVVDLDEEGAKKTAEDLCTEAGNNDAAKAFIADVASPEAVEKLKDDITQHFGSSVDILVNNAALISPVSLTNGSDANINRIIDVNIKSHFWMNRTFLPSMKSRNKGHIVTICSMAGLLPLSRAVIYTSTKFAIRGMSLAMEQELRDDGYTGIRVSVAYPYFLATRKEIFENINLRLQALDPAVAAETIVSGVRRGYLQIGAPRAAVTLGNVINALPDDITELFRKTFTMDWKIQQSKN